MATTCARWIGDVWRFALACIVVAPFGGTPADVWRIHRRRGSHL